MSALRIRAIHPEKSHESDYKQCVDALYRYFQPDYILFFGAIDILPQQKLYITRCIKPIMKMTGGCPPATCLTHVIHLIAGIRMAFFSPVRVWWEALADINGVADLKLVTTSINNVISFTPKSKKTYEPYFAASVPMWRPVNG